MKTYLILFTLLLLPNLSFATSPPPLIIEGAEVDCELTMEQSTLIKKIVLKTVNFYEHTKPHQGLVIIYREDNKIQTKYRSPVMVEKYTFTDGPLSCGPDMGMGRISSCVYPSVVPFTKGQAFFPVSSEERSRNRDIGNIYVTFECVLNDDQKTCSNKSRLWMNLGGVQIIEYGYGSRPNTFCNRTVSRLSL